MYHFVIILSTVINASYELNHMELVISGFKNVIEWSCDLDDEDHVLRIVSTEEISTKVIEGLRRVGVSSQIMGVFIKDCLQ
jgi:hypothetical protein